MKTIHQQKMTQEKDECSTEQLQYFKCEDSKFEFFAEGGEESLRLMGFDEYIL